MSDDVIGVAKRDIEAGETITVLFSGPGDVSSEAIEFNETGKKYMCSMLLRFLQEFSGLSKSHANN